MGKQGPTKFLLFKENILSTSRYLSTVSLKDFVQKWLFIKASLFR